MSGSGARVVVLEVDGDSMRRAVDKILRGQNAKKLPAVTIPGVPDSITRELYCDLIKAIGLDPYELVSLEFGVNGIEAEVYAKNTKGYRYTVDGENVATHRISIPIIDKEPE